MQIEFLTHASIAIRAGSRTLVTDPWFDGKVFNNAWALISPAVDDLRLRDADYVWISHEHPDHFHIPTLRGIPAADKSRMTVLYQRHASPRLVHALMKLGFGNILELPLYQWCSLEPGIDVFCGSAGTMDSFLAVRSDGCCVLNINDCVLNTEQLKYVKRRVGSVDVLFTQFSFANWVGNDSDEVGAAAAKIRQLREQIVIFQPRFTVPFASFAYFCNAENSRMNGWANTPASIAQLGLPGVNFMYPGDVWDSDQPAFRADAVERYMCDYATRRDIDPSPPSVDMDQISAAIEERLSRIHPREARLLLWGCQPFDIHIKDQRKVVRIEPGRQTHRVLTATSTVADSARYAMCSQVAWYTFAFPWGPATTQVGGMYLDRHFRRAGPNRFFRLQNALATEVLGSGSKHRLLRTADFWWRKRGEMLYRMAGELKGQSSSE